MTVSVLRRAVAVGVALLVGLALLPPATAPAATSPRTSFHVVRFDDRITDGDRNRLEATGAVVIDYQPVNGYLVWASSGQALAAARLPHVARVRPLRVAEKIDPALGSGAIDRAALTVYGPAADDVAHAVRPHGEILGLATTRSDDLLASMTVSVETNNLAVLAAHPGVLYISHGSTQLLPEDELTDQVLAGNITNKWQGVAPQPSPERYPRNGYRDFLKKVKLDGKGIKVAIVDSGVQDRHPDLTGKVVERKDYSRAAEPVDAIGHGTHVAGIVGGLPTARDFRDPDGFSYGLGVAPGVELVDMNAIALTADFRPPEILALLAKDAWQFRTRLWNASWHTGEGNRVGYVESVRLMDELARNAVLDEKGSEEYLFIFSAGNAGDNGPTVPKEAKNIITVGSTVSGRGLHWPLTTDIDEVSTFSSKGPTKDGRIFPTISAPGENVMSARAPEGALIAAGCAPALDSATLHTSCSGTSMAAPHVTGAAALLHEWWKREHGHLPSPSLVKALFVNSATDIAAPDIPNNNEGWGRVNMGSLFGNTPFRFIDQTVVFERPRREVARTVRVNDADVPFKVTLAWADAPARVGAKRVLVNDLDLIVERLNEQGRVIETWLGNSFTRGWSQTGGKPDRLNNLENVYLKAPARGEYRVRVRAVNVPGDGIPENTDRTDQDFALVLRGGIAP